MMNFDLLDSVTDVEGRHNMQDWMIAEQMYNCEGFAVHYYREQSAETKKGLRLFRRKDF